MVAVLTLISGAIVDLPLENERARRQALTCDSSSRGLVEVYYQDLGARYISSVLVFDSPYSARAATCGWCQSCTPYVT